MLSLADLFVSLAYFSIPIQIVIGLCKYPRVTRRATKKVVVLLILFALFIFLCGAGHLLRCIDMGNTRMFRAINTLTALVSMSTSFYLLSFVPHLLDGTDKLYLEATTSKSIIAKMYPPQIRERLLKHERSRMSGASTDVDVYDDEEVLRSKERCSERTKGSEAIRQRIEEFIRRRQSQSARLDNMRIANKENELDDVPIADDFSNTSIMFADISSFTYWASQHSPIEVFTLLESLFFEFDRIANKMGVYKLSTVGDCYIAVTGVPYPQEDHAIILTKFAECCRQKASEIFLRLSPKLDTDELGIRVGVHSGPVTAGILRGDKARFDLFGDTINTAQRIESTGKPNAVHLSLETAKLIEDAGKADWILPRKDAVMAKGKGDLKTFWLVRGVGDDKTCDDDPECMV